MIDDDLSPEVRALFDAEQRRCDAPPPGAKDRVSHALSISLGIGIGAAAAGSASATTASAGALASKGVLATGAATTTAASVATTGGAAAATTAAGAGITATGGALAKGLAFTLVTAMAGTTGTGIYLAMSHRDQTPAVLDVAQSNDVPSMFDPSLLATREPDAIVEGLTRALLPPVETAPVARVSVAPITLLAPSVEAARVTPERLRGERAVLDSAHAAVRGGDGEAALVLLESHRKSYADGALVEERDALTVLALAKLGRSDDATKKAAAFRAQHPRSLFLPAIDGVLR